MGEGPKCLTEFLNLAQFADDRGLTERHQRNDVRKKEKAKRLQQNRMAGSASIAAGRP